MSAAGLTIDAIIPNLLFVMTSISLGSIYILHGKWTLERERGIREMDKVYRRARHVIMKTQNVAAGMGFSTDATVSRKLMASSRSLVDIGWEIFEFASSDLNDAIDDYQHRVWHAAMVGRTSIETGDEFVAPSILIAAGRKCLEMLEYDLILQRKGALRAFLYKLPKSRNPRDFKG